MLPVPGLAASAYRVLLVVLLAFTALQHVSEAAAATWRAGFETGDFSEWSWWGQGQPDQYPRTMRVVDPSSYGVPRKQGRRVARLQTTSGDIALGRVHAKLYEFFHAPASEPYRESWRCPNVSGSYRAWFYLPPGYAVGRGKWVTAFQFKDNYWTDKSADQETSSPTWWVAFKNAAEAGVSAPRLDQPVALVQHWEDWVIDGGWHPGARVLVPLGRWFEIRADVYDHQRIDVYLDGRLLGNAYDSHYPVGCSHATSFNWIFGVGQYATSPGTMYVDEASYGPLANPSPPFFARASGYERRHRVRVRVLAWRPSGAPLARARVTVIRTGGGRRRTLPCGRTNARGRTSCLLRRPRGTRLSVSMTSAAGLVRRVPFWRYRRVAERRQQRVPAV